MILILCLTLTIKNSQCKHNIIISVASWANGYGARKSADGIATCQ